MSKLLASLALIFATLLGLALPSQAAAPLDPSTFPACAYEDGSAQDSACYWDAQGRGNGLGQSIIIHEDDSITETYSLSALAPQPITEDTTTGLEAMAWGLFDATGASDLLPDTASTVTFTASSAPGDPIAPTADTIVCTDMLGNTYQFTIS